MAPVLLFFYLEDVIMIDYLEMGNKNYQQTVQYIRIKTTEGRNLVKTHMEAESGVLLLQDNAPVHTTPMDPHIWPGKSRTTSMNIHSAAI